MSKGAQKAQARALCDLLILMYDSSCEYKAAPISAFFDSFESSLNPSKPGRVDYFYPARLYAGSTLYSTFFYPWSNALKEAHSIQLPAAKSIPC